ncbi:hypothetical protein WJX73_008977 [Symbiochloris irregularis]|uniref:Guanylate kinase 1 n=1 Tax=Symbiochloris irregularis TaxID=706552 RepID=A0AAW1NY22_9CHLO
MGAAQSTQSVAGEQAGAQASGQTASLPSALVICGPSGVGKGTLIKRLMESSDKFGFSCSHTTREARKGEEHGKHYWFTSVEKFEAGINAGKFLEHARVHHHFYGTSVKAVEDVAAAGRSCILDIDVQGARQVRKSHLRAVFVFIAPPSMEELERRLRGRNTESTEQVEARLANAKAEIASIQESELYDYILCNDNLDFAFQQLTNIAQRALAGQTGNGVGSTAVTLAQDSATQDRPATEEEPLIKSDAASVPEPSPSDAPGQRAPEVTAEASVQDTQTSAASAGEAAHGRQHPSMDRWRGKVALVTGASSGIGWAVCEALAGAGLRVVAVARRRDRLEALQQALVAQGVPIADFLPIVCDITKEAEVVALPRIIVKRWPEAGIDVLVNNAGLGRDNAALCSGSTASWVEMVSTNVLGLCMATREAVQDMKRRGEYGHIINVSSMAGHRIANAAQGGAFYSATKHAVKCLTEGLRQEARAGKLPLRVTELSPGQVN